MNEKRSITGISGLMNDKQFNFVLNRLKTIRKKITFNELMKIPILLK
jgi:hypothetical protein